AFFFGDGTGNFGPKVTTTIPSTLGWWVGRFSPDNHLGILVGSDGSSALALYPGDGHGAFPTRVLIPTAAPSRVVAVGDSTFCGRTDVLLAQLAQFDHVSEIFGDPAGYLSGERDLGGGTSAIGLADVNGDGSLDIVSVTSPAQGLAVLLGNGKGDFAPAV